MCRDGTQSLLREAPAGESIDQLLEQAGGFGRCQVRACPHTACTHRSPAIQSQLEVRDFAPQAARRGTAAHALFAVLPDTASLFEPPAQAA